MESQNLSLKTILKQPLAKWGVAIIGFFLVFSLVLMGLSSKYDLEHKYINICAFSLNCHQSEDGHKIINTGKIDKIDDIIDGYPETRAGIPVKPLSASIIAGGVSTGTLVFLIGAGFIDLPIVLAVATGTLIGYGTYIGLDIFY